LEKGQESPKPEPEYTVVGVIDDGEPLNRAIKEIRDLGVRNDDLTVILKRKDIDEAEPFPAGTRYIVVPDDRRGLEVPIGFSIVFVLVGIFFALITPPIGVPALVFFIAIAAILLASSSLRVGIAPILTDMEPPREEADIWGEQFEMGKVLIFASTKERRLIRPIREALQSAGATYYIVDRRLEPRAIPQAVMRRAGERRLRSESVADRSGSV